MKDHRTRESTPVGHRPADKAGGAFARPDLSALDLERVANQLGIAPEHVFETIRADPELARLLAASGPLLAAAGQQDQGGIGVPDGPLHRPGLTIPEARPGFAEQTDGEYLQTPGGFTIEIAEYDIRIYDPDGRRQTRIWGDPHVDEGEGSNNWHFGQDSTFILTDGTKICLDTEPNAAGEWYVVGADILSGTSRYHYGVGDEAGMTEDALDFDKLNADRAADCSAGVFAMAEDGQWAVQAPDGHFYDITEETWAAYQGDRDIDFDPSKRISLTDDQKYASQADHLPAYVPPPVQGQWMNGEGGKGPASMKLTEPQERPSWLRLSGSDIVQTPDGYTVEMKAPEVMIFDRDGQIITRIWGDPHVDEGGEGTSEWHFGEDSTFILPDGTKISLDTEPNSVGEWYVVGADVTLGATRFHHGVNGETGMTQDGIEWDHAHADRSHDESAGVFALQDNGEWAVKAPDGHFYDITPETWEAYLGDRDIDFDPSLRVNLTVQQTFAAQSDQLPADMRIPEMGQIPDLDWLGNEETVPALGTMSQRDAINTLQRYMPIWHINLISARAPRLLPMIAEDKYLAQHLAEIPLAKFKQMLSFLPANLLGPIHKKKAAEEKPDRRRKRFDRSFLGWEDRETKAFERKGMGGDKTPWWLSSGSFAR